MTTHNVLLITVDSLRADAVGSTRNGVPVTPRFDALADRGTSFLNAVANGSNTPSSFPSLLTSTHPLMYGGYDFLDKRRPFVANQFRDAGYRTVGFHSNPHLGPDMNYDFGFDAFNDRGDAEDRSSLGLLTQMKTAVESHVNPDSRLYGLLRRGWHHLTMSTDSAAYADATEITESALEWLESWRESGEDPFFMWLHYMDVHYPFLPPEEHLEALDIEPPSRRRKAKLNGWMHERPEQLEPADRSDLLNLYFGEARYADHEIGRFVDELSAMGALEDTLVVLTADHGEAFGEHGRYGHHPMLYDELLRVPLILSGPGVESGLTVNSQVSLIDIGPTLYDLTGITPPDEVQGRTFAPVLRSEQSEWQERPAIVTAGGGDMLACRTREWKCFWRVDDGVVELYDLTADPQETTDVSGEHPEVVERLRGGLESYLSAAEQTDVELPSVDIDDKTRQRLRDLGYSE